MRFQRICSRKLKAYSGNWTKNEFSLHTSSTKFTFCSTALRVLFDNCSTGLRDTFETDPRQIRLRFVSGLTGLPWPPNSTRRTVENQSNLSPVWYGTDTFLVPGFVVKLPKKRKKCARFFRNNYLLVKFINYRRCYWSSKSKELGLCRGHERDKSAWFTS